MLRLLPPKRPKPPIDSRLGPLFAVAARAHNAQKTLDFTSHPVVARAIPSRRAVLRLAMDALVLWAATNGTGAPSNVTLPTLPPHLPPGFCQLVSNKSVYNIALGAVLCVGALLSFLPQHWSLLRSRSAKGLSWTWMLLSNIASWCLLFNVIGLNYAELGCCSSVGFGGCMEILLPMFQVGVAAVNMWPIFLFYVIFAEREQGNPAPQWMQRLCHIKPHHWARYAFLALTAVIVVLCLVWGLLLSNDGTTKGVSAGFGVVSTVTTLFMWLPQIFRTFQDKVFTPAPRACSSNHQCRTRALSRLLCCMRRCDSKSFCVRSPSRCRCLQLPGNMAAIFFQAIMEQESITTWGSYLVSSVEQALLIFLAVYYKYRRRRLNAQGVMETDDDDLVTEGSQSEIDQISAAFASDFVDEHRGLLRKPI